MPLKINVSEITDPLDVNNRRSGAMMVVKSQCIFLSDIEFLWTLLWQ